MKKNRPSFNFVIVGLGNPGGIYRYNRHNMGTIFIDWLHHKLAAEPWQKNSKIPALVSFSDNLLLVKTLTFMNESGRAIKNILQFYKTQSSKIIIAQDDTDILWGKYKLQFNRGSAGHKGIESIFRYLKTKNFYRLRIGVRPINKKNVKAEDLVLQNLSPKERKELPRIFTNIFSELQKLIFPQGE